MGWASRNRLAKVWRGLAVAVFADVAAAGDWGEARMC
jgi:hypothetical protein